MVKKNVMHKNVRQTISKSLGRYIAIVLIIALGAGMFVGLLTTKTDMVATAQKFTDDTNMFDLRLLNTYGWSKDQVAEIAKLDGIVDAEGGISLDVIGSQDGEAEAVYRLHSIPETVNKVYLLGGRMPQKADECLVDGSHADDSVLGKKFTVSGEDENLVHRTYTVVGYVSTPIYMDMSRGSTTLGSGTIANYIFIPQTAFQVDYFTEIAVTMAGDYEVYTDAFDDAMKDLAEQLEPDVTILAHKRFENVKDQAQAGYDEGLKEYQSGVAGYEQAKSDAQKQLDEALAELQDAQALLDAGWAEYKDGEIQIYKAQTDIDNGLAALEQSKVDLADAKAETYALLAKGYDELTASKAQVSAGLAQARDGLARVHDGIVQLEDGLKQIEDGLSQLKLVISIQEAAVKLAQLRVDTLKKLSLATAEQIAKAEADLAKSQTALDGYIVQRDDLAEQQAQYSTQLEELKVQRAQLTDTIASLEDAQVQIDQGFAELESQKALAQSQFADAEAQIIAGEAELDAGQRELDIKKAELAEAKAELDTAQVELDAGRADYEQGKLDMDAKFSAVQAELDEAKAVLDDSKSQLDGMEEPEVYILDRNTNPGYLAVDNNSDIVQGVSRVFPAFFLLVAALVCITTMTRMVDEERTQIGVLKALGYGNRAIMNKYLFYTGSAAVVGCGLGVLVGSVVFPTVLWMGYRIILNLTPNIVLTVKWPLCLIVVAAYTAVSMLATWYCCRRELREVPAELIRPKAPTAGKKIWMEHLPFWNKISFLKKVMFRNVFRYRQRLLMMMVGIGGCMALLLTGFGIGDSITNIVDIQYEEVTTYDMDVYFSEGQSIQQQMRFRDSLKNDVDQVLFYHQSSVDLEFDGQAKEIFLRICDENIGDHIDFHRGDEQLTMPGVGETYLTVGTAEALGIREGDTITVRTSDLKSLELKVAGIFDNHVYNFAIVLPETVQAQWGQAPAYQMAYVTVDEGQDVHAAGAKIAGMEGVLNVTISEDLAEQVGSMLEAMDVIVLTVVVCAALLAVIVIYNLTNISITERMREIATIKVLGFHSHESAAYVFKENLLLTAMGAALGLVGGIFLLEFVMSQIKIDMVWFQSRLDLSSYVWAMLITMLSACAVDAVLYFKLEKINMAEALKSVE